MKHSCRRLFFHVSTVACYLVQELIFRICYAINFLSINSLLFSLQCDFDRSFSKLSPSLCLLQPDISSVEVVKFAEKFSTTSSCVIKIVEPRAHASLEDLKAVVLKVNTLEEKKTIPPWEEEQIPEEIVSQSPVPGYYDIIISLYKWS